MRKMLAEDHDIIASRAVEPFFSLAPFPEHPDRQPAMYQHAGVEYAVARDHALIGDAPGVGKSCEAILISNAIEAKSTLVVCPASLRLNWEKEAWMWANIDNVSTYPILKAKDGVSLEADYVIVSYDMLRNPAILDAILSRPGGWDHLILDEVHYIKDPQGNARTRPICAPDALPSVVGRITGLSGTIMPNQPIECYNIIRLLNWDAIDRCSVADFREFYYAEGEGMVMGRVFDEEKQGWVYKAHWSQAVRNVPRNLDDLQFRLRKNVMVRRLKEQVLHELPERRWHPFPMATTPEMRAALRHPGWAEAEKLYKMDPENFSRGIPVDGAVATARRLLGEAKAPAVAKYIDDLIDSGVDKIVVGAWNHTVLDYLRKHLTKHGLVYMDGGTTSRARQKAVDDFQARDDIKIILGQIQVLMLGWTLTRAQDVVAAEYDWVPGNNDQLLDRIHRRGQVGSYVLGHVPVVPGTLDEKMLGTVIVKDRSIYQALDAA